MYSLSLKLKSFDLDTLRRCEKSLLSFFTFFHIHEVKHQVHPQKCKKITVCRSPHIDKKSREHFQILTYKKTITSSSLSKPLLLLVLEILNTYHFIGVEVELLLEFSSYDGRGVRNKKSAH